MKRAADVSLEKSSTTSIADGEFESSPAQAKVSPLAPSFAHLLLTEANTNNNPLAARCDEPQSRIILDNASDGTFLFRPSSQSQAASLSIVTHHKVLHKRQSHAVDDVSACVKEMQAGKISIRNLWLFSLHTKKDIPVQSSVVLAAIAPVLIADTGASLLVRYKGDIEQEKTEPIKGSSVCTVSISLPLGVLAQTMPSLLALVGGSEAMHSIFIDIDPTAQLAPHILSALFWRLLFFCVASLPKLATLTLISPIARLSIAFSSIIREITLSCTQLSDLTVIVSAVRDVTPLLLLTSFSAGLRREGKECVESVLQSLVPSLKT